MFCKFIFALQVTLLISGAPLQTVSQTQQPPNSTATASQDQDVLRVATKEVHVEAIVTEKSGRRVKGLRSADFEVLDEGKPQPLQYFTEVGAAKGNLADGSSSGKQPEIVSPLIRPFRGRYIALVLDDLNLSNENFLRSRGVMTEYIKDKLSDTDLVAMVSTAGALGSLQQFTNDRTRLSEALKRIGAQSESMNKG
jgi:VWFA-related protein